jgi:hypothetical protein
MDQFPECRILQSSPKLFDILPILAGDMHENDWSDLGFILGKKEKKSKKKTAQFVRQWIDKK